MQTQHNTIMWRLLGGIAAVTALLLVYSVMAIVGTQEYHDAAERLYRLHGTAGIQLSTANDRLWHLRYSIPQYLISDAAGREKIAREELALYDQIREIMAEYTALPISTGEREQLEKAHATYKHFIAARPEWFSLVNAGKLAEAAEYRIRAILEQEQAAVDAFTQLLHLQQQHGRDESSAMIENAALRQKAAIALMVVMLVLVLPLILSILKIMRTLKIAQKMALDAATNVFKEPIVVAGRDELDTLITTIEFTSDRFVSHTKELESARNELARQHENMEREVFERTIELQNALVDTERQANEAARLAELNDRLQNCQDQAEAGRVIATFAPALFIGIPGRLSLINASRNLVDTFAHWGTFPETAETHFDPESCWGLRRNRRHYSSSESHDVCCAHVGPLTALCVPLHTQDGALGVLTLNLDHAEMARQDVEQLSARFANQVALALTNLRLREKLREQSILDSLTTLYNRRYFEETLGREIARAERHETFLSLIVLDVDHFKRFNDTYGHEAGDRALNLVGQTIKSSIRPSDVGCRYGGEEFVIVMPDASVDAAVTRANEIRHRITQASANFNQGEFGQITVSCGVAAYPLHGQEGTSLFIAADKALYEAKHHGRNKVETAFPAHSGPLTPPT